MKQVLCAWMSVLLLMMMGGAGLAEETAEAPAVGYVRITVGTESRWFPLPPEEDYTITVRQTNPETGEEMVNYITLTPDGVYMKESTCDHQDCVDMGVVTLENKAERILGNVVVCLPHQVMLELYSTEELMNLYGLTEGSAQ